MSCPLCHKLPCECYTKCNKCQSLQDIGDSYCRDCGNTLDGSIDTLNKGKNHK